MARPVKQGLDYFPHDTDASSDPKVEALVLVYGLEGYAFYFRLLECLYRTPDCEIDISATETKEETLQILALKTAGTREKFDKMLATAIRHGCFDKEAFDRGVLTSSGAKKRAQYVIEKRIYNKERYIKVKEKEKSLPSFRCADSAAETPTETENKVNTGKIFKTFEANYQQLTEDVSGQLNDLIDTYSAEKVLFAIKEGIKHNKRSLAYIEGVLKGNGKRAGRIPTQYTDPELEESE